MSQTDGYRTNVAASMTPTIEGMSVVSTVAGKLAGKLRAGGLPVVLLDGDDLRDVFGRSGGHDRKARLQLGMQYARLARLLALQGITVIVATISMFRQIHAWNRKHLPRYFEVYLHLPLEELIRRDPKGIYRRYYAGKLRNVAGLDLQVDEPTRPDLLLRYQPGLNIDSITAGLASRLMKRKGKP